MRLLSTIIPSAAILSVTLGLSHVCFGQDYNGNYDGNYYAPRASTVGESYARGAADVIRSRGQAAYDTSRAAINVQEATRRYIDNRKKWTETYFEMRSMNRQYRAAERGPRATEEQLIRFAQAGKPKDLGEKQLDPYSGKIQWPLALQDEKFAEERKAVEGAFSNRALHGGAFPLKDYNTVLATIEEMDKELKQEIKSYPPNTYLQSKNFLKSLAYETRQ